MGWGGINKIPRHTITAKGGGKVDNIGEPGGVRDLGVAGAGGGPEHGERIGWLVPGTARPPGRRPYGPPLPLDRTAVRHRTVRHMGPAS
jgi:hypothetical protein